jgi:hypothetical protein
MQRRGQQKGCPWRPLARIKLGAPRGPSAAAAARGRVRARAGGRPRLVPDAAPSLRALARSGLDRRLFFFPRPFHVPPSISID